MQQLWTESFTSWMAGDFRLEDINRLSSFKRFLNGTKRNTPLINENGNQ